MPESRSAKAALASLVSSPAAGFDEPFEMLAACHDRVRRSLDLLTRLREHVRTHGADDDARSAVRDVLRYFNVAAPQHHLDEERHVFPRLLDHGDAHMRTLVKRLQHDHVQMGLRWPLARDVLSALADGQLKALSPTQEQRLDEFASLYAEHLKSEDEIVYPAAAPLFDAPALAAMGQEMKARRGAM